MTERHLLGLSGGKDSAALAVYMKEKYPHLPMEYVFIDSGYELPETYAFLTRLEAILGINVIRIKPNRSFDYWLKIFNGVLPSPNNRWCTKLLKIHPYQKWLDNNCKGSTIYNYAGLRSDEDRDGFQSKSKKVVSVFPFVNDGLVLKDILNILDVTGIGLPKYYSWRNRSGCYFCFFQSERDWLGLKEHHPDLFEKACQLEENHSDGRSYYWRSSGPLRYLLKKENTPTVNNKIKYNKIIDIMGICYEKKGGENNG